MPPHMIIIFLFFSNYAGIFLGDQTDTVCAHRSGWPANKIWIYIYTYTYTYICKSNTATAQYKGYCEKKSGSYIYIHFQTCEHVRLCCNQYATRFRKENTTSTSFCAVVMHNLGIFYFYFMKSAAVGKARELTGTSWVFLLTPQTGTSWVLPLTPHFWKCTRTRWQ